MIDEMGRPLRTTMKQHLNDSKKFKAFTPLREFRTMGKQAKVVAVTILAHATYRYAPAFLNRV